MLPCSHPVRLNARRVISQSKHADLLNNFTKNCGFGIGLEFRDVHLLLTDKNPRLIQPHMVFNLAIGFTDLVTTGTNRKYAVYLADTVVVKDSAAAAAGEGPAKTCEALTKMPREWKDVSYLTGKEGEDDEGGEGAGGDEEFVSGARATRGSAAQEKKEATGATAAEKVRAEHQAELARRQREVALKKLAAENAESAFHSGLDDPNGSLQAYASPAEFPSAAKKDRIFVDMAAETLLLPIYDQLVPFHINTVKNVHRQEEGTYTSVRITFITPDAKLSAQQQLSAGTGASSSSPSSTSPSASHLLRYISELTYRTASSTLDKVFYDIKELKKRVQNRLKEFEARSSLVAQADLVLDKVSAAPRTLTHRSLTLRMSSMMSFSPTRPTLRPSVASSAWTCSYAEGGAGASSAESKEDDRLADGARQWPALLHHRQVQGGHPLHQHQVGLLPARRGHPPGAAALRAQEPHPAGPHQDQENQLPADLLRGRRRQRGPAQLQPLPRRGRPDGGAAGAPTQAQVE